MLKPFRILTSPPKYHGPNCPSAHRSSRIAWMVLYLQVGLAVCRAAAPQAEADRQRFEELKAQAEKGEALAQYNLGVHYIEGKGVLTNQVEGAKWFRKAADQGDPAA